ncbi:MAG: ABC transporter ATP-binding protein [Candidatus Neomarinimicrobiota bacterium]|nr:ABC transporter ATP-binding protein [Candidatus Neomarinimicrobiota bacterium]
MEASITLKKVGKLINDKTIVAGLTFGIERGSLVAVIGANDTGKSVLLRLLSGFEKPDYGNIFINGLDMQKRRSKTRRLIGFVPHETDLDPWLSLEQNIKFSSLLFNVSDLDYKNRIKIYSDNLGITSYMGEIASQVSYGIQKRAMLVRALIHNPEILVLDEPTGFMDAPSVRLTWDLLKKIKGEKSIIYVSNALIEVEQAHDRILVFKDGKIIMDGSLDKLLESTLDYHQFQIEFDVLTDDLYKSLSNVATVVSPSRISNIFHFYGRERSVFFDIIKVASENLMIDLNVKKLGLRDLMDSEFAGGGLD